MSNLLPCFRNSTWLKDSYGMGKYRDYSIHSGKLKGLNNEFYSVKRKSIDSIMIGVLH